MAALPPDLLDSLHPLLAKPADPLNAGGDGDHDGKAASYASAELLHAAVCCLVACVASFISFGVQPQSADNAIAGAILACSSVVMLALHRRFTLFALTHRRLLVSKLLHEQLPLNPGDERGTTRTQRGGECWTAVPHNLLCKGDVVDLNGCTRAPARCRSVETGDELDRDALVPASTRMRDVFKVLEAPLPADIDAFLRSSDAAQRTSIGCELVKVMRQMQLAGGVVALLGVVLGAIRLGVRPDNQSWADVLLTRPSTLLILLPPMSSGLFRSALEAFSASKLVGASPWAVLREWLASPGREPLPLCPAALLHALGSVTALCALDEDSVLAAHPIVEEVFLLKGEGRTKIVDCCADATAKFGVRFEDPRWSAHVESLKPIGLACALGATKTAQPPPCMRDFAWTIGFTPADAEPFTLLAQASVVGDSLAQQATRGASWSVAHGRPCVECAVLSVPAWQQAANAPWSEAVHVLCWGHPSLLLPFCKEYWDGESIWTLDEDSRAGVKALHAQWAKEDFDCVAFAYGPAVNAGAFARPSGKPVGPLQPLSILFPSAAARPHVGSVGDAPVTTTTSSDKQQHPAALAICLTLSRGLVFTGLVASRDLPRPEVVDLVADLAKAGVRFVFFSAREPRRSRVIADKMGLETDWNTSISLQAGAVGDTSDVVDWELKAHMPRGVDAIAKHVREVDDVPLRVPVFTDSAPGATADMVRIMRAGGDVVACLGTARGGANLRSFVAADVSFVVPAGGPDASEALAALACSCEVRGSRTAALRLLGEARVRLYNYKQCLQGFCAAGVLCATAQFASLLFSAPDLLTAGHALFLLLVQLPLSLVPVALRRRQPDRMLFERMPWKKSAAPAERRPHRYAVYLAWRAVPPGLLCTGLFLWQAAASGLDVTWGRAVAQPPPQDKVVAAQSVALLALAWTSCHLSWSFANRTEKPWQLESSFYAMWAACALSVLALQFAYNCAYATASAGACSKAFDGVHEGVWLALFLAPAVLVPALAWPVKAHDQKHYRHTMEMLRLTFETKLGQFSPR